MSRPEDLQSKAGEMMKKILTVGVGAFFLTEESLRGLVTDFKLPKELLAAILETANKTKGEFLKNMSKEVMAQVMERMDLKELVQEVIANHELEMTVHVNFKPKKKKNSEKV